MSKRHTFLTHELKLRILDTTRRVADSNGGEVPNDVVQALADYYEVSPRSIRRWIARPPSLPPPKRTLTKAQLVVVAQFQGNRTRAHQQCQAEGFDGSYTTFRRRLMEVDPVVAAGVTQGGKAAINAALYGQQHVEHRLDRVYFDHEMAPVEVAYRGQLHNPWNSWLIDGATGYVLAKAFTLGDGVGGVPHTEVVTALVAQCAAGHIDDAGNLYGGVPAVVWFDNARAHLGQPLTNGCIAIGSVARAIPRGSPWMDGRVERFNLIFEDTFCSGLPRFTHGHKTRYGKEPLRADDVDPISFEEYVERAMRYVDEEMDRPDREGKSRRQRWLEDPTPIQVIPREELRHLFVGDPEPRIVSKNGIKFDKIFYIDPEMKLRLWRDRSVRIRYSTNERKWIDVYDPKGEFICTAVPTGDLDAEARAKLRRVRNNSFRRVDVIIKEGAKRALARSIEEGERRAIANGAQADPPTTAQQADLDEEQRFLDQVVRTASKERHDG